MKKQREATGPKLLESFAAGHPEHIARVGLTCSFVLRDRRCEIGDFAFWLLWFRGAGCRRKRRRGIRIKSCWSISGRQSHIIHESMTIQAALLLECSPLHKRPFPGARSRINRFVLIIEVYSFVKEPGMAAYSTVDDSTVPLPTQGTNSNMVARDQHPLHGGPCRGIG